jgi:dimethylaniline monooxygenase (N-oxide forming)
MQPERSKLVGKRSSDADRRYAIIGAGAAGICAARQLRREGFSNIVIYEIGSKIGGLWCYENDNGKSAAYRTLHINTARAFTTFTDREFDAGVPLFPAHGDMYAYLQSYVAEFDLGRHIRFNTEITALRPADDGRWTIETAAGAVEKFDRVIVAAGHLWTPRHVPEVRRAFCGEYVHSFDYRGPERFVGKRICVIGAGNSGFDIASDVCMVAARTVMVARSGITIAPKFVFGRAYRDITFKFEKPWIPDVVRRWVQRTLIWTVHGDITRLGFVKPIKRSHNASNPTLINQIAYRRIDVKNGIVAVDGNEITFSDGTRETFDTVACATGYKIEFPFIAQDLLPVHDNFVDLYKRIVAPDMPGVYFIGYLATSIGLFRAFERQTAFMAAMETGKSSLPDPDAMRADIAAKKAWVLKVYYNTPRHSIEEPHLPYFKELKAAIRAGRKRLARAGTNAGRSQ